MCYSETEFSSVETWFQFSCNSSLAYGSYTWERVEFINEHINAQREEKG